MVYFSLIAVSLVGGALVFFQKRMQSWVSHALSFSGAYLLGICLLHLIPELYSHHDGHQHFGLYILIGFFLQLLLDYSSGGIEHGHTHVHQKSIGKFPWLILISLCIHALLEALPLAQLNPGKNIGEYLSGLLLHKIPISFVLVSLLIAYRLHKSKVILGLFVFSLMGPLGIYLGTLLGSNQEIYLNLLALSIGIILHLSTTILIESNDQHKIQWIKLLPLLLGFGFALLNELVH